MFINWPKTKPEIPEKLIGALNSENKVELERLCKDFSENDIIVELGTYYGMSTKFLAENSKAKIITVDHFRGSKEHNERDDLRPLIPAMYETFLVNLWDYKDRIHIYRGKTVDFLLDIVNSEVASFAKIVYIDASHEFIDVYRDLELSSIIFCHATICGDDFKWKSVKNALNEFSERYDKEIEYIENFWELIR